MGFNKHRRNVTCNLLFSLKQEAKSLITVAGCRLWHCEVLAVGGGDGTSPRLRGWCWRWGLGMLWGALVWLCLMPGGVIWAVWGDGLIAGLVAVSPHGVFGPGAALCHFSAP